MPEAAGKPRGEAQACSTGPKATPSAYLAQIAQLRGAQGTIQGRGEKSVPPKALEVAGTPEIVLRGSDGGRS